MILNYTISDCLRADAVSREVQLLQIGSATEADAPRDADRAFVAEVVPRQADQVRAEKPAFLHDGTQRGRPSAGCAGGHAVVVIQCRLYERGDGWATRQERQRCVVSPLQL